MIEYEEYEQAQAAVKGMNGQEILGQAVEVSFCFNK